MASIISAGTTSGTALNMSGDTSGVLQLASNNGTVGVTLDTSQNVGIGVTAPSAKLNVRTSTTGSTANGIMLDAGAQQHSWYLADNFTSTFSIGSSSGQFTWANSGGERMRIDSSGNVGIGTSSPRAKLEVTDGTTNTAGEAVYQAYVVGADRSGLTEGNITVQSNDAMAINKGGSIAFGGRAVSASASGANWSRIAGLKEDGTTSQYNGYLQFCTRSTAGGMTEKMRIDSIGNVIFGGTSANAANTITIEANANSPQINFNTSFNGRNTQIFKYNSSQVGSIVTNSGSVSFNTTSDYRLKENIAPITGALAKVALLKPVTYKWKADGSDTEGFIAHELAEVCPHAVSGAKDAVDEDGNPQYQGIDVSFLVATLTAAIQELKAINDTQAETINALTARIVALESKA
jgi:hypothetical protein